MLLEGSVSVGSEQLVQLIEGTLGPNNESSELATRSQLEKIQSVHINHFDSRNVSESLRQFGVFIEINNEGTLSNLISLASLLSDSGSDSLGVDHLLDILEGAESLKETYGILGSLIGLESILNDQGNLGHLADSVTSGKYKGDDTGGSDG